ncbi:MAG TPA: carboxypeptidase regulatory-like domain-containing protein [Acidobacteriaceae bacterium]|jgi:hypothetical protein|nr:carboxypeptidase regulatory-like domain-containing protein [Acidobacteriaceae bacterium]
MGYIKLISAAALCVAASLFNPLHAENVCKGGDTLTGIVLDATGAIIPGASISLDNGTAVTSGFDGRFHFACETPGEHHLHITAQSFAPRDLTVDLPLHKSLNAVLQPEEVQTTVDVGTESSQSSDPASAGPTQTISGDRLQTLADDPDDLLRELQQMAAASGGNPANTTISVDGFQESSTLPPKSSIAYIKVNPDLFSAEYREPPFDGGRVEVYTKPGQKVYHGTLFATNGSPWMNARDPFSTSKAPLGKQRYGFELTGPVRRKNSDFTLDLEHRSIDNYGVVNAITLDSAGNQVNTVANVATPQRLWIGMARVDWQLGPKNTFIATYSANVNHLQNVGVGGTSLAETGYDSQTYEHVLRFTNITTASAKLMHEARLSLKWAGENDNPGSTAPQVSVAGAFTGGGATVGAQQLHDFAIEVDDDAILSTRNHLLKFGTQLFIDTEHDHLTTSFNGTYTFGGGTAPVLDANGNPTSQTETITGLEQYRRALLNLPGGAPTAFSNVAGTPILAFTQLQDALFIQDDWKVRRNVHLSLGMRYFLQDKPATYNGATPRFGISWSPDKKATWTLHGHLGLFTGRYGPSDYAELQRMDGIHRITSTVYNPACAPVGSAASNCNPFAGATPIQSIRTTSPHLAGISFSIENLGFTHAFPHGWNLSGDYYLARIWNYTRSENINSPLTNDPTGPRPGPPDLNILQMQDSGQGNVNVQFVGLEQHTLKRIQFFVGGLRINQQDDTDDNEFFTPQSSTSDVGELARRTGNPLWRFFANGNLKLPEKIQLSGNLNAGIGAPYNITTGFDNNGDGDFNDRPQYARPGDPNAVATRYGLLVASGGTGVFPRNRGRMPATVYLDTNLQRAFKLTKNSKADHPQTLTVNLREANLLNHMNITQVGGVLGSPLFGVPYAADNGRRIEAGLRYTF